MAYFQSETGYSHLLTEVYQEPEAKDEGAAFSPHVTYLKRRIFGAQAAAATAFVLVFLVAFCLSQLSTNSVYVGLRRVRRLAGWQGGCSRGSRGQPTPRVTNERRQTLPVGNAMQYGMPGLVWPRENSAGAIPPALRMASSMLLPLHHYPAPFGLQTPHSQIASVSATIQQQLARGAFSPVEVAPSYTNRINYRDGSTRSGGELNSHLSQGVSPNSSTPGIKREPQNSQASGGAWSGTASQRFSSEAESGQRVIAGRFPLSPPSGEGPEAEELSERRMTQQKATPSANQSSYAAQGAIPRRETLQPRGASDVVERKLPRGVAGPSSSAQQHESPNRTTECDEPRAVTLSMGHSQDALRPTGVAELSSIQYDWPQTIVTTAADYELQMIKNILHLTLVETCKLCVPVDFFEMKCRLLLSTILQHLTTSIELLCGLPQGMRTSLLGDTKFRDTALRICGDMEQHIFHWFSTVSAYVDMLQPHLKKVRNRVRALRQVLAAGALPFVLFPSYAESMRRLTIAVITRGQRMQELSRTIRCNKELLSAAHIITTETHLYLRRLRTLSRGMIQLIYVPREIIHCLRTAELVADTGINLGHSDIVSSLMEPVLGFIRTEVEITAAYNPEMSMPPFVTATLCQLGHLHAVLHSSCPSFVPVLEDLLDLALHPVLSVAPKRNAVMPYVLQSLEAMRTLKMLLLEFNQGLLQASADGQVNQEPVVRIKDLLSMRQTTKEIMFKELGIPSTSNDPDVSLRYAAVRKRWIVTQLKALDVELSKLSAPTNATPQPSSCPEDEFEPIQMANLARRVFWSQGRAHSHRQAMIAQSQNEAYMDDSSPRIIPVADRHTWLYAEVQRLSMPFRTDDDASASEGAGPSESGSNQRQTGVTESEVESNVVGPCRGSLEEGAGGEEGLGPPTKQPEGVQLLSAGWGASEGKTEPSASSLEISDRGAGGLAVSRVGSVDLVSQSGLSTSGKSTGLSQRSKHDIDEASGSRSVSEGAPGTRVHILSNTRAGTGQKAPIRGRKIPPKVTSNTQVWTTASYVSFPLVKSAQTSYGAPYS